MASSKAIKLPDPWPLPKNGIYYLRLKVPRDIVGRLGRDEIRVSLRTRDRSLAVRRLAIEHEALMARFTALRARVMLSHRQCAAVAGLAYREKLATFRDDPGDREARLEESGTWGRRLNHLRARGQGAEDLARDVLAGAFAKKAILEAERRGVALGDTDLVMAAASFALAEMTAAQDLARHAEGDYSERFPDPFPPESDILPSTRTKFAVVFEEYIRERLLKPASHPVGRPSSGSSRWG